MSTTDKPMRIFVVDDHRDVAEGLADVLRMHGHEVEVAFNGEQAIRTFRERDFDIAFMDVMMPGMNGVESFMEIRKIKPAAKVIMMTGYSVEQLLDQAVDKGAYGVLHKPVAMDDVLEAVERVKSQGMVLVADDDPEFSASIKEVLEDRGYRVCLARTGSEALKTVIGGGVDILLLDLQLPVISGLEVYMQLRQRGRAVPTVVVTGHSREQAEAIDTLRAVSTTGILTKPFASSQLFEELQRLLPPQDEVEEPSSAAPEVPATPTPEAPEAPAAMDEPTISAASETSSWQDAALDLPSPPADTPLADIAQEAMAPSSPEIDDLSPEWPLDQTGHPAEKLEPHFDSPSLAEPASGQDTMEPAAPPQPIDMADSHAPGEVDTGGFDTGGFDTSGFDADSQSDWPSEPASQPKPQPEARMPAPAAAPAPAARQEIGAQRPEATQANAPASRGRILAVDDDVDMLEGLAEVLRTRGYEVKTADNAEDAKELIRDFDAQVALLDIRLGKANGLELIPVIKAERPNAYCVMITGNSDKESAITALRIGAYDYMTKPLHPSELFAILDRCLEKFDLQVRLDQAFEALQAAKNEAESISRNSSEFLAKLTGELGQPIGEIMSSAKIFTEEAWGPLGAKQYSDHAQTIRDNGSQILDTLKCALDLAKAQAGTLEINEGKIDITALVRSSVKLVQDSIDVTIPAIEVQLPDSLPMIWGDERQIEQVILNLLSNAVKFTPEDGQIRVELDLAKEGGMTIAVCDTGIGMAPSDIPMALSQFGRVDNPGGRKFPGIGLGLSTVAAIAKLHGGTLTLDSELGKGTIASVSIPVERIARDARKGETPQAFSMGSIA